MTPGRTEAVHARVHELERANAQLEGRVVALMEQVAELVAGATALRERNGEAARARSETQLARRRLVDALESITDPFFTVDPEWRFTFVNTAAEQMVNRPRSELHGRSLWEEFPEAVGTDYYINAQVAITERRPVDFEAYYPPPLDIWTAMRLYPLGTAEAPEGLAVYYQNITLRKRAEAAMRDSEQQLRALVESEHAARAEAEAQRAVAEQANRAKGEFLSTMSHELRTPRNAITGHAQLLSMGLRGPLNDEQRLDLERIGRASQHLMSLVTDILNFARLEAGQVEFNLEEVDVDAIIADLESLVGPQLTERGLVYDHVPCGIGSGERVRVLADPEKLRQVILNLLTNAIKFTDAGGHVTVSCVATGDTLRLSVTDTGRGIAEDELARIFEPFVQVDRHRTHTSQQGVGLGLAISRDLARGMGGDLVVESAPGKGSIFTVVLPLS